MCLIVFAWRPEHHTPLLVAANRDEFYARPALSLRAWPQQPHIYSGLDLEAGGTWLGYNSQGRFAALTNIRDLARPQGTRSRGHLVADFLTGDLSPAAYLQQVSQQLQDYSGFNLLVADRGTLMFLNADEAQPRALSSGVYGLSNATLDSPWPKLQRTTQAFRRVIDADDDEALFSLLADRWQPEDAALPHTGVNLDTERMLSSTFIASPHYGTRASSVLRLQRDGAWRFSERSFSEHGQAAGATCLSGEAHS